MTERQAAQIKKITRWFGLIVILFVSQRLGRTSTAAQAQIPIFRTAAAFVRVDVYPSKDGRIVPGLSKNDFQLFEDGKPQTIETFEYVEFPTFASEAERRDPISGPEGQELVGDPRNRVFVLYLDTFFVSLEEAHTARLPLIGLLDRTIGPSDLLGVLTPSQTYSDLVFGRRVSGTERMLQSYWLWGEAGRLPVDDVAMTMRACYAAVMDKADVELLIARERQDRTLLRLRELVDYLGRIRQERKNLVIFTHGWELTGPSEQLLAAVKRAPRVTEPSVSPRGTLTLGDRSRGTVETSACEGERIRLANVNFGDRFRELVAAATRANVSFYPVNPAGLDPDLVVLQQRQRLAVTTTAVGHLRELAANTDGVAVVDTNDLRLAMAKITDSLAAYYVLGYYPANAKLDGTIRSISVKGPAGLELRARRQYRAADERDFGTARVSPAFSASAPESVRSPLADLDGAFTTLIRANASRADISASAALTGPRELTLIAEALKPVGSTTNIQLLISDAGGNAAGAASGRIAAGARAVLIRVALATSTNGPWHIAMRIAGEELRGSENFVVAPATGVISDPILQRIDSAGATPVAIPIFSRRDRLRATWKCDCGALTRQEARLLDRRGQPLPVDAAVTASPAGAGMAIVVDVALASLAPGDYVLELTTSAGGSPLRRLVAFRIAQ